MNIVTFPGLNLTFTLNKIAFNIFGIDIYWYSLIIFSSIVIGLILAKRKDGMYNIKFSNILDIVIISIPISILFARIYYVIFSFENYKDNLTSIFNLRNGGIAIYGAIIGGVISIICYCKINKINVLDVLDYIVPYAALGQAIGRWGNFINVEAYGSEYLGILRMGIIENGKYIEVHPTFLYESIITSILFIFLITRQNRRKYKGEILLMYLIVYSFFRGIIEELRVDSLMIGNMRVSKVLSICIFVVSIFMYMYKVYTSTKYTERKFNYEKSYK